MLDEKKRFAIQSFLSSCTACVQLRLYQRVAQSLGATTALEAQHLLCAETTQPSFLAQLCIQLLIGTQ